MIPTELCHYTKRDIALENILFDGKIKFGQLRFTNDPKDSRFTALPHVKDVEQKWNWNSEIETLASNIQLDEWKVLCLTKNIRTQTSKGNSFLFQKGYCRPRMWAQYAENHRGVCLIFDGKRLHENIKKYATDKQCRVFHGPVSYKNAYKLPGYLDISNFMKFGEKEIRNYYLKFYKEIFLSKYLDWKNESEYRWLIHNQTPASDYVSIEGALTSVLVGMDFPVAYEPALKDLCKKLIVSAGRVFWFMGAPHPALDDIYKP